MPVHVVVLADRMVVPVPGVDVRLGVGQVMLIAMGWWVRLDPDVHHIAMEQAIEVGQQIGKLVIVAERHHSAA